MRWASCGRRSGLALSLACLVTTAATAAPHPGAVSQQAAPEKESGTDILVQGQRREQRYRLPPDLRTPPPRPDHRAAGIDPNLACMGVGPMGCGLKPLPILTMGSDGALKVGDPNEP